MGGKNMKKIRLIVAIIGMAFCMISCGKSKEDELVEQYQNELGLNKEEAKELAEVVLENESDTDINAEVTDEQEELIDGLFAPCFKGVLESLKIIDIGYFRNATETYVLEKYGKPSRVSKEYEFVWYYDLDDEYEVSLYVDRGIRYGLGKKDVWPRQKGVKCHPDAVMSDNYDQIKEYFDDEDKYLYGFTDYKYSDFVELFGNEGTIGSVSIDSDDLEPYSTGDDSAIQIDWHFENGKVIMIGFNIKTGELYKDYRDEYNIWLLSY